MFSSTWLQFFKEPWYFYLNTTEKIYFYYNIFLKTKEKDTESLSPNQTKK